jgi:uncharacterized protein
MFGPYIEGKILVYRDCLFHNLANFCLCAVTDIQFQKHSSNEYERFLCSISLLSIMVKIIPASFYNRKKQLLRGIIHLPREYETAIILLHGFPSSMDGNPQRIAAMLSKKGYLCLRFNFSGTDTSQGLFEAKLMSEEVRDTQSAVHYIRKQYHPKKIIIYGHSTGAIDAALYAGEDKKINGVVLFGVVSDLANAAHYDFNDEQIRQFWTKGYTYVKYVQPWMKKHGKIFKAFYDEFFQLNIIKALKKYRLPVLIMHGEQDKALPAYEAKILYRQIAQPKKLCLLKGVGHSPKSAKHIQRISFEIDRFIRSL